MRKEKVGGEEERRRAVTADRERSQVITTEDTAHVLR